MDDTNPIPPVDPHEEPTAPAVPEPQAPPPPADEPAPPTPPAVDPISPTPPVDEPAPPTPPAVDPIPPTPPVDEPAAPSLDPTADPTVFLPPTQALPPVPTPPAPATQTKADTPEVAVAGTPEPGTREGAEAAEGDTPPPRDWRRIAPIAGAVAAAALLLTICATGDGGDEPVVTASPSATPTPTPTPTATPTPTPTPTPLGPPAPLTGMPTADEDVLDRRAVAIKIDNHDAARPQPALNAADSVIELPVEAGLTRFIALFHSGDSDNVGPVRSGRPTDPTLVAPLDATLLISGAQSWVLSAIRKAGVPLFVDIGEGVTWRSPAHFAPHDIFANTYALREAADARGISDAPPPEWFLRSDAPDAFTGDAADRVVVPFTDTTTVTWDLVDGRWERTHNGQPHLTLAADGSSERVVADHLVVFAAPAYTARNPVDGGGLPALDTVGSGRAWVAVGGEAGTWTTATWSRSSIDDVPVLTDEDGDEITIPPGRVWVSWMSSSRTPRFSVEGDRDA